MAFLHSHLLIHLLAIPIIILTFAITRKVDALNCYICAEGGLEEFGECKMSFPFNCDGYARRYAPTEKIFCRTTRHKTFNGTHTVVKECIAESAHYATFARKSQSLDEECDVLDLNGFEVAYCLCRDADLCNSAPIVDQFTEFENKHPDLFDPIPASNEASTGDDIDTAAEQRTTTITVDNHRFLPHPGEELTIRPKQPQEEDQQQQQLGEHSWPTTKAAFQPNPFAAPPRPAAENANSQKEQETVLRGTRIGQQQQPPEEEAEEEAEDNGNGNGANSREELEADTSSGNDQLNSGAFVTAPAATASTSSSSGGGGAFGPLRRPNSDERPQKSHGGGGGESTGTGTQLGLLPELQCMQCNDQNLPNSASDCRHQIVISCPDQSRQLAGIGRPLCLTKQSQNGNGRGFSVEKQCTTERGILNEVGGRKAADLLNAAIRDELACLDGFCVCSSAQCNRPSLAEQQKSGAVLEPTTQRTNAILGSTGGSSHLQEVNSPAIQTEALNCAVCLDVELRDPKADCRNARTKNCAQELHNEKAFCLTRQTQNGKDGFIVEKSCVSRRQFYQQFPEELDRHSGQQAPLGCASTYEGAVNYCLCDGQMCNREGIAKQQQQQQPADLQGNKKSSASPFPATNSFIDEDNGQQQQQQPQTTAATRRPAATTANFTTAAGGGAWERQEDGDALAGTGHATKINPAPANFGPTSFVATSAAAGWTTTSTPPSTTPATSTTATSALRDRLEKWKANSEAGDGKKTVGRQRMDIFDELADENSAAAAFGGWTTKWLTFAIPLAILAAKANIV